MGAEPKKLGVPGEEELAARGVSYCATCDAAFFRDKPTIVVGGGDTAMEDAIFLSKFAKRRQDRPPPRRVPRVGDHARPREGDREHRAAHAVRRSSSFEAGDDGALATAVLKNTEGGEDRELEIDGAFIAIGHQPNSQIVEGQVELDEEGYVITEGKSTRTKLPGVFAAGDLVDHTYRQAVTAAGSGCRPRSTPSGTCATAAGPRGALDDPDPDEVEAAAEEAEAASR